MTTKTAGALLRWKTIEETTGALFAGHPSCLRHSLLEEIVGRLNDRRL